MDLVDFGKSGVIGLMGAIVGFMGSFFTVKARVNGTKEGLNRLSKSVRYADTCKAIHEAGDKRLENIEKGQDVMQEDIKEILRRLPK